MTLPEIPSDRFTNLLHFPYHHLSVNFPPSFEDVKIVRNDPDWEGHGLNNAIAYQMGWMDHYANDSKTVNQLIEAFETLCEEGYYPLEDGDYNYPERGIPIE